jgi:hypothetical protein
MEKRTGAGTWLWTSVCLLGLALGLQDSATWDAFRELGPRFGIWMTVQNALVVVVVIVTHGLLKAYVPVLNWSWLRLFASAVEKDGGAKAPDSGANINVIPLRVPWVGLACYVLLLLNIPFFAVWEERVFRQGTDSVAEAIIRSLAFGLAHCVMGVSVNVGLAIAVAGLWYSYQYANGGVLHSAAHHATYNLIILGVLGIALVIRHVAYLYPPAKENLE